MATWLEDAGEWTAKFPACASCGIELLSSKIYTDPLYVPRAGFPKLTLSLFVLQLEIGAFGGVSMMLCFYTDHLTLSMIPARLALPLRTRVYTIKDAIFSFQSN